VMHDGVKGVTEDFVPPLRGALGGLAVNQFLCSGAFCERLDDLSLIYTFFDLILFLRLFTFSTFWCLLYF